MKQIVPYVDDFFPCRTTLIYSSFLRSLFGGLSANSNANLQP